jgi:hypothetical protein
MRGAALLALALGAAAAQAGEIRKADILYRKGAYSIDADIRINAPVEAVRAVVTDYEHLDRLSPTVSASRIIERYDERHLKRLLSIDTCVLFFCTQFDMVERVEELPSGDIVTTIIPEESDFDVGESRWRLVAVDAGHTSLLFTSARKPHFWIPPLIGPWFLKNKLRAELKEMATRVEALAADAGADFVEAPAADDSAD